jgi:hypothetical protein
MKNSSHTVGGKSENDYKDGKPCSEPCDTGMFDAMMDKTKHTPNGMKLAMTGKK